MGLFWGEAQIVAKDHDGWRTMIDALCPIGGEEHYKSQCMCNSHIKSDDAVQIHHILHLTSLAQKK